MEYTLIRNLRGGGTPRDQGIGGVVPGPSGARRSNRVRGAFAALGRSAGGLVILGLPSGLRMAVAGPFRLSRLLGPSFTFAPSAPQFGKGAFSMEESIGTRNRRRFVRLYRSFPCQFRVVRPDGGPVSEDLYPAETRDLSLGGLGLVAKTFPDSGVTSLLEGKRLLRVRIDFGVEFSPIEIDAHLRWMEKGEKEEYVFGVQFVVLPAEEKKLLSDVLHSATEFRRQLKLWETDSHRRVGMRRRYVTVVGLLLALFSLGIAALYWGLVSQQEAMAREQDRSFGNSAAAVKQAATEEEAR